jgi:hypothetical protein
MVVQEDQHERDHRERGEGDDECRGPPAVVHGQVRHQRQEDQLAGRAGGGQDAADQAAAGDEPAAGDGRDEGHRHRAGADADEHSPAEQQLPARGHEHRQPATGGDQHQGPAHDPADPEPVHQCRRERREQAEQHEVDRDRGRDRAA